MLSGSKIAADETGWCFYYGQPAGDGATRPPMRGAGNHAGLDALHDGYKTWARNGYDECFRRGGEVMPGERDSRHPRLLSEPVP